jgi:hypothetical protein
MSLPWLAGSWLAVGALAGLARRWPRLRRPVALLAAAALVALTLLTPIRGIGLRPLTAGPPVLSREAAGLLVASLVALAVCVALSVRLDGAEMAAIAVMGAAAVLVVGARSPLLFAAGALVAVTLLALRWFVSAPGRPALAAGRVAAAAAAALLAASVFLPLGNQQGPSADAAGMVAGLLAAGLAGTVALVPVGGWAAGAMGELRAPEAGAWLLLLAPAIALSAVAIPAELPLVARLDVEHTLLVCGLVSAGWAGIQAIRARSRVGTGSLPVSAVTLSYRRLALGDLGLVMAAIGSGQPQAAAAALLLVLTHLVAAPLLLHDARTGLGAPRHLLRLAVSGLPPAPSFWGRLLVLEACAGFGSVALVAAIMVEGLMTFAGVLAVTWEDAAGESRAGVVEVVAGWAVTLAAVAMAAAPAAATHLVFGSSG